MTKLYSLILLTGLTGGCGAQDDLDVGDESTTRGATIQEYAYSWDGYAEAFEFQGDKTDRVRLTLDEDGNGTLRFGEEPVFSMPTQPDEIYPATYPEETGNVRTGFEYQVVGATVSDTRLEFSFFEGQLMAPWCALQVDDPSGFFCARDAQGASTYDDSGICFFTDRQGDENPVPCHQVRQCSSCRCEQDSCDVRFERTGGDIAFDGTLSDDGSTLTGTLVLPRNNNRVTVRFSR